jgi:internalin A
MSSSQNKKSLRSQRGLPVSTLMYTETPLDPRRIARHWRDAGLAFEKHRWRLPTRADRNRLVQLFTFGDEPLQEIYIHRLNALEEPDEAIPLAFDVVPDALALPVCFSVLYERDGLTAGVVEALVTGWQSPIHLVFSWAPLPPFNSPPTHMRALVESILDRAWTGDDRPGWVPLPEAETRRRALHAFGIKGMHRLYLVAGPADPPQLPIEALKLFEGLNGLTAVDEPDVDYRAFHTLLSNCDWVLTSHRHAPGAMPFCFYSQQDLRSA